MTMAREMIPRFIYTSNAGARASSISTKKTHMDREVATQGNWKGLLLREEAKDSGQEAKTTDVSYN